MNKILVTGGAGFIGSNLVKALLKNKNKVIVVDNFSQGKRKNLSTVKGDKNLEIIKADILDNKKMVKISKGVDVVFHLAVQCLRVSLNNPLFVERVDAGGTLSVLWAAHKNRVRKFIYCSSSEVYGSAISTPMKEEHLLNPTTVYGASKLTGEIYTTCFNKNYSLKTVIVRPFNTYGYNEHMEGMYGEVIPRFIALAKNNLPLTIFGSGKQTRDFTFVTDTVDGLIKAANYTKVEGDTLNIAYGKEISINKIAQIVVKVTRSKSKIIHADPRPHDVSRHYASISKATRLLGYRPNVDIEEGIKLYVNNLKKEKTDLKKILNDLPKKNW